MNSVWPVHLELHIHHCGSEHCQPGHSFGPVIRNHFLIHYVDSGKGIFSADGKTYSLSRGQGFVIFPGKLISYISDANDPWIYSWIGFSGEGSLALLSGVGVTEDSPVFDSSNLRLSQEYMDRLQTGVNLPGNREYAMLGCLLLFLSTIDVQIDHDSGNMLNDYTTKATDYIAQNFAYDISVDDVARHVNVSRSHLFRIFKEQFGLSIQQYLMNVRISTAAEMLSTTDYSIHEICYSCGFKDCGYFAKAFQKQKELSPTQYRSQYRIRHYGYNSQPK